MTSFALRHRVFVMTLAVMAMLAGATTFLNISRREDPEMKTRTALVVCQWPGAPALKVDELVADVLEGAIQRVDEVDEIRSTSNAGVTVIRAELGKRVNAIDQAWTDLRNEVRAVEGRLPAGASTPIVNTNFGDVSSLCLTMYQVAAPGDPPGVIARPYTDRELEVYGERLEDELEALESVSSVSLYGLAEERIYLEVSSANWSKLGLTPAELRSALDNRNIVVASGELETSGGSFLLRATGELESLEDFGSVTVGTTDDGRPILLRDLPIRVRRGLVDPIDERVRFLDGTDRVERAVMLGIEMKDGNNVVEMGEEVAKRLEALRARALPPDLEFATVNDLPRQVDVLVKDFVTNLWQAILIVLVVAFFMMGWRPAVVMAAAVPLCMITALAVVRLFGVELEQFSIASLIIALGMIVDNAIVVSDQTTSLIQRGESRFRAALRGAKELAIPILTSTLTTVAAFLPLLTIPGGTGEYIRSLPIVVSVTLLASYFVAMTVTPILCFWLLRPPKQVAEAREGKLARLYGRLIERCLRAKLVTLGLAVLAVLGALSLAPLIGNQFFPGGVRDQFFVHVRLPYGSTTEQTTEVVEQIEDLILETAEVRVNGATTRRLKNAYAYIGSGGPRLMLTMDPEDPAPRYAFLVVNTTDANLSAPWAAELRELVAEIPGARIDVRTYVLGPPLDFPVEYRLSGPDPDVLREMGDKMVAALRETPGTLDPYHDWGNSTYQIEVDIDDQRVLLAGLSNRDVADSLNGMIAGTRLTEFREGDYTVPVELRLDPAERRDLRSLDGIFVGGSGRKVPLDSVATITTGWQPATIARFNRTRAIVAGSQVAEGYLSTSVSSQARAGLSALVDELPEGYELTELGEQKESAESQADMGSALLLSLALILLVLIGQYNSVGKPIVVLSSAPLALIGALIGLLVTGWPLGFMPMLGIVSLVGVVINNAIILLDFVQTEVSRGVPLREAVPKAGKVRMKPISLTTLTTVGGMLPLALFGGPMWAGMSYAMIFGLLFSTVLTLVVVPTIYVAFVEWFGMPVVQEDPE